MAQKVLIVGPETGAVRRVLPTLERADFAVEHVARCKDAVAAVRSEAFVLLIVRFPVGGLYLDDLVTAVRSERSPSRSAGLILLSERGDEGQIERYLGRGVNQVVLIDALSDRLPRVVDELLAVATRQAVRVVVRLELSMRFGTSRTLAATENISLTGMLVRGGVGFPVGTLLSFELALPDAAGPIRGEVRVVRRVAQAREGLEGIGVQFVSFLGDGQQRLAAFLARQHG